MQPRLLDSGVRDAAWAKQRRSFLAFERFEPAAGREPPQPKRRRCTNAGIDNLRSMRIIEELKITVGKGEERVHIPEVVVKVLRQRMAWMTRNVRGLQGFILSVFGCEAKKQLLGNTSRPDQPPVADIVNEPMGCVRSTPTPRVALLPGDARKPGQDPPLIRVALHDRLAPMMVNIEMRTISKNTEGGEQS